MGACSPAPVVTSEMEQRIMREVIRPTLAGLKADGIDYSGFLYAGLMIAADGAPRVLEFNCRFGDPETQPIMTRLKSDLVAICKATLDGSLGEVRAQWDTRAALGVVMAAGGYPAAYRRGDPISGLPQGGAGQAKVFHAGTALRDGDVVTNGGRVLCVTALGDKVKIAAERAYEMAARIRFDGMQYRRDIGHRAFNRR
jgi:phosphoribosylamine--glycine ligase